LQANKRSNQDPDPQHFQIFPDFCWSVSVGQVVSPGDSFTPRQRLLPLLRDFLKSLSHHQLIQLTHCSNVEDRQSMDYDGLCKRFNTI
jgi:hypothetical protein